MFDVWIANSDRHDKNAAVDNLVKPTAMQVYDHDCALFGPFAGEGVKRLDAMQTRLGITGGPMTRGNRNIFLSAITTNSDFSVWLDRIRTVPHWFVKSLCDRADSTMELPRMKLSEQKSFYATGAMTCRDHQSPS